MKRALFILTIIFSSVISYGQGWEWAKGVGCNGGVFADAVTTDNAGNIYVVGGFSCPSIVFGNTTLINTGPNYSDIFIVKYDPLGNVIWAKSAGGSKHETAYNIAADATGNIYVTGTFYSPILSFGGVQLTSFDTLLYNEDLFLAKYDTAGNAIWAIKAGDSVGSDRPYAIAIDAANNIYIAGQHGGASIDLGTGPIPGFGGGYTVFLAKYDPTGTAIWAQTAGGTAPLGDGATALTIDVSGHLYMTGLFRCPSIVFGNVTLNRLSLGNSSDMFLVKYDTAGNALWGRSNICGSWGNHISSTTDNDGNIYISGGYANYSVTYGTTTLPYAGQLDAFIAKYDPSGNVQWARSFGGPERELASVICDPYGKIYMAGVFENSAIDVGPYNLVNAGGFDIVFGSYNAAGDVTSATCIASSEEEFIFTEANMACDNAGNIYLTGRYYSSSLAFGTQVISGSSDPDRTQMFLAKWTNSIADVGGTSSVKENLTIYPNPAYDQLNIETTLSNYSLSLINTLGQIVYTKGGCNRKQTIDISQLVNGIYYLRIEAADKMVVNKKVMVQH